MNLIGRVTEGIFGESFLAALVGGLTEGIMRAISKKSDENKNKMKKLKEALEEQGYDLSELTMKFQGYGKTVFEKADVFFNKMNSYKVIFDLVALYDGYGNEIDVEDIMEAMMDEGDTGDDDDLNGWGDELDSGGFSGWD
jgi:hypothetical protein